MSLIPKRQPSRPKAHKTCVLCAPEDFNTLGATAHMKINGKSKLFKVIPDPRVKPGEAMVMYKGCFKGTYLIKDTSKEAMN